MLNNKAAVKFFEKCAVKYFIYTLRITLLVVNNINQLH